MKDNLDAGILLLLGVLDAEAVGAGEEEPLKDAAI